MITKFIDRLLRRGPRPKSDQSGATLVAHKISKKTHRIDPALLSKNAVKVTHTLQQGGYKAYIVGGAVRDLVLGIAPKDFDVATNATPEQVQKLFRRSRLIGRRFQIVHVTYFGKERPEIIEVSTFRAVLESVGEHIAESGRILRDNVWGTHAEDAARRDFTINAMYYDPSTETVLDYHGGMEDIRSKTIRMIGNPTKRYREDPVRMLRAIRFAAKTGFQIEPKTLAPIHELSQLIHDVPSARLFDEILKLLMSGHAWAGIQALHHANLHHGLLPFMNRALEDTQAAQFIEQALRNTDERIQMGKSVSPGFLFAALLWPDLEKQWQVLRNTGMPAVAALHAAIDTVVAPSHTGITIQRRHEGDMRDIWTMQPRFEKRVGRYPERLLEVPRFRAGYDFMLLRSQTGYCKPSLGQWWTDFYHADLPEREALLASAKLDDLASGKTPVNPNRNRRRRPKKPKPNLNTPPDSGPNDAKQS